MRVFILMGTIGVAIPFLQAADPSDQQPSPVNVARAQQPEPTAELAQLVGVPASQVMGGAASPSKGKPFSTDDLPLSVDEELSQAAVANMPITALSSKEITTFAVDEERKKRDTVKVVKSLIEFLKTHRAPEAFYAFTTSKEFIVGDIVPWVYSEKNGTIFVRGEDRADIWKDIKNDKNKHGVNVFDLVKEAANNGGGWIQYEWKGGYKLSYVERVTKGNETYLVGAGWFPVNKRMHTEEFVRSAVEFFNENGADEAFRRYSNPIGDFISGDLYIFVYHFDGQCVAHGDNTALIGRDFSNDPLIRKIIEVAKKGGGWLEYQWKHAPKIAYIEKISDKNGDYAIGAGYYPDSNRDSVVSMVKRAIKYFNAWGRERAAQEFSMIDGQFIYGDLYISMYDFNGKCIAHGDDATLVGQDLINLRMTDGTYVIKELIEIAKKGGGWLEYRWRNDIVSAYAETVSDKQGRYVVTAGFYPYTKREICIEVVKLGMEYLRSHTRDQAFEIFTRYSGPFVKGDVSLFVFNQEGDCFVYGDDHNMIWRNFKQFKDADGRRVIEIMLDKARKGGGWIEYISKHQSKLSYVQSIEKDGVKYIIGSAYYT